MVEMTTLRIWIGITIAWPVLLMLVFNRWFFLSPLGLILAFGLPIGGWTFWWKFYRDPDQKIVINDKLSVDKGVDVLQKLKKRLIKQ